ARTRPSSPRRPRGPRRCTQPCGHPGSAHCRPRRATPPPAVSTRGRTRPVRARGRSPCGVRPARRYRRQMTALEGELEACGVAGAPPSAAARLKEVLSDALKHGRSELTNPRSGLEDPVEVALAAQGGRLVAATPAAATIRADPEAVAERE